MAPRKSPSPASTPIVHVHYNRPGITSSREALTAYSQRVLDAALREAGWSNAELTVLYCSRAAMQRLNREFRGIDIPTDVLSFPTSESLPELQGEELPYLGDLAICLPVCIRQARESGRPPAEEASLLLVHGLLHLLGWDHDTARREKAMWAETDRLLAASAKARRPALTMRDAGA